MLRAIRFAANLDYKIEEHTKQAIKDNSFRIKQISAERIQEEITKILRRPGARYGLELMAETGMLHQLLPEIEKLKGVNQPPRFHPEGDVWEHTLTMLELLPFGENGEANFASLNMVLHHAALPQQVFCELARVLAPGGGITLADLHRHEHEWVRDVLADQWLGFERTELEGWLLSAGFELTSFQIVSGVPSGHDVVLVSAVKKHPSADGALL